MAAIHTLHESLRATEVWLPTLDVRSRLVGLDIGADGVLQPPADPDVAGWFVRGAAPGEPGPAVIAGRMPTRRQADTSSAIGRTIQEGSGGGIRGRSVGGGPKRPP